VNTMPNKNDVEITSKIDTLLAQLYDIECDIKNNIAKLPAYKTNCKCSEQHPTFKTIHIGNLFDEIHRYCIVCGGIVEENTFHKSITICQTHVRNMVETLKKKLSEGLLSSQIDVDIAKDMSELYQYETQLISIKNGVKRIKEKYGMI